MCDTSFFLTKFPYTGCGGASSMFVTSTIYFDTLWIHEKASYINYLTYLIHFILGFSPMFFLIYNSKLKFKNYLILGNFSNLYFVFIILYLPISLLFVFGLDWGRWINIVFTLSYLLIIFLRINKFIFIKSNFFFHNLNKYLLFFYFYILLFVES